MLIWRVIGIWRRIEANLIDLGATMKSLLAAVLMSVALSGCIKSLDEEWRPYKQAYEQNMTSWVGATESKLVDHWGTPDGVYTIENSKYLMYRLPRYRLCEQTFKITKGVVEQYNYNVKGCYSPPTRYY